MIDIADRPKMVNFIIDRWKLSNKEKTYILRLFHFFYITKIKNPLVEMIELTKNHEIHQDFNSILTDIEKLMEENYNSYFAD